jgi:hypothetical protein
MKLKHHFWTSLAIGGAISLGTGSVEALAGAMIGGVIIDADHIIDQVWSINEGAPLANRSRPAHGKLERLVRRRKLIRLPLIFHSYELMIGLVILAVMLRTPFIEGLVAGYLLHIALDLIRHHREFRSPLFYLLSYRLVRGFRRERLIKPEYL